MTLEPITLFCGGILTFVAASIITTLIQDYLATQRAREQYRQSLQRGYRFIGESPEGVSYTRRNS